MKKAHGLRRYFYEYVFYQALQGARDQTGELIPLSQGRVIRGQVDELLGQQGTRIADPELGITSCLEAIDSAIQARVPGYSPQFGDHTPKDPTYQGMQREFTRATGVGPDGDPRSAALPISPYDPAWADRATIRQGGNRLAWIPDETITEAASGEVETLDDPRRGAMTLYHLDDEGRAQAAGRAMTGDDFVGLSRLMDKMSERDYAQVRQWALDGSRDPATGRWDRSRVTSREGVDRCVAVLEELKAQGLDYEVLRDREPGQLKAKVLETGMEVRLLDPGNDLYAGARIYDNGTVLRHSTNYRLSRGTAVPSPAPADAVRLLHIAQGREVQRTDDPSQVAGSIGSTHLERGRQVADSYHVGERGSMFVVDDYVAPGESTPLPGMKIMVRRDASNRSLPQSFVDPEVAQTWIAEAVESARVNLGQSLEIDRLIEHVEEQRRITGGMNDLFEPPEYSADPEVAAFQRSYVDVLTGTRMTLPRPGVTEEMLTERLESIGELTEGEQPDLGNLVYSGSPEQTVRDHADDVVFELIGTAETQPHNIDGQLVDQSFDPVRVAKYMTSANGQWANMDSLAAACRRIGIEADELMGTGFQINRFKDRLVRFDPTSSVRIEDHPSVTIRGFGQAVSESLQRNAAIPRDLLIDDQGVISWSADKLRRDGSLDRVHGQIGQVFDIGDHGEIRTQFRSGENALIVPGYEARIVAQTPGERPSSVEERTRLRGYEQMMRERIEYQIAGDLVSGRQEVGEPSSVNSVYSRLTGTKHPVDFIEQATRYTDAGVAELDPWVESILATEARRVRYSNEIRAGSTIYAEYRAQRDDVDAVDDNHFDAWRLTGGRNMAVLTGTDVSGAAAPGGYFDPVMTGNNMNQGIVRYLTQDAEVSQDGTITPGDPSTTSGNRTPLMARPELESLAYDPFDRQQMTASTIMQSSTITDPVGTALMTFGGWTADDPIVVSSEFAQRHQIRGIGGEPRDLVPGDKLSDLHGNKGVVSLVVDRHMDPEQAREQGIEQEVAWFKNNLHMDVVMSPFSLISRRNAGAARELMERERDPLLDPGYEPLDDPGYDKHDPVFHPDDPMYRGIRMVDGVGTMRFVVTHMAVDEKTKIYDEEAIQAGHGRKASSQLAWALQSKDCPAIMREFYGHNSGAEANLREYLLVSGLDMEADGTLRVVGVDEALDEAPERRLIRMPELVRTKPRTEQSAPGLNTTSMRKSFASLIGDRGGDLEIPFPLTYPTGEQTETATQDSWKVPVLSSHLRSGQEFEDGSVVLHDHTRRYEDVFVEACRYRFAQERLADESVDAKQAEQLRASMAASRTKAQRAFEVITTDVQRRVFSGKTNVFKTGLMTSRLTDSATMVWTSDPRLDIDQVALSRTKAEQLGLEEGDHALIWRDPVLRDAGVRYLRVAIDDRLTGAAINPVMDASFDGDFDGDAVAVVKIHSPAAQAEAMRKFSVPNNLLETGLVDEQGRHPLSMAVSLDTKVALADRPELAEELESLVDEVNAIERDQRDLDDGSTQPHSDEAEHELAARRADVTNQLSDFYRSALRDEFGSALSFADAYEHVESLQRVCVDTGAKGSQAKLAKYAQNLGLEVDDYGRWTRTDLGRPGITQVDQEASMFATAIKAHGTGLGGSFSQRAMRSLREADPKAVLEVTYPVTQSILQAKHDAGEARHKYEMLHGAGRELWRGRRMEQVGPGQWQVERKDGEPVQATTQEWTDQFVDFYRSADGFGVDVNPEYVQRVAAALADPESGRIRNLEEDPQLTGSVMDRMAYGGTFEDLLAAARGRENVYDGAGSEQFAASGARRARRRIAEMTADANPISEPPVVSEDVVKRDVLADTEHRALVRDGNRRSAHAVPYHVRSMPEPIAEEPEPAGMEL